MDRKIVLTKIAVKRLNALIEHLESNWSVKAKYKFLSSLEKKFEVLIYKPEAFTSSKIKRGLHKCVITKQTSVYYTFNNEFIFILTIFDNRQNPNTLKGELKNIRDITSDDDDHSSSI